MRFGRHGFAAVLVVALLCAGCSSNVSGHGTGSSSGKASSPSSASSPTMTVSSGASSSRPGSGAEDWAAHTNFATLPHPDLNCAPAGLGGKVDVLSTVVSDLTGDGIAEAVVRMECSHSASEWPDTVDVYSDSTGTPTVIGSLLKQNDDSYAPKVSTNAATVTLSLSSGSSFAPGCCPDLNYTQTFTWNGHGFTAGPKLDVVKPCGDTAFITTSGDEQGATGHSSIVLRFRNRLSQACTIQGYPGLDAMTSSGAVLAHATRTLNGFAGGAHAIASLTVAPGQTVSALVEWMNFNPTTSGSCATSATIQVTPANTSNTVSLAVPVTVCDLQVHPTVAGSTGDA